MNVANTAVVAAPAVANKRPNLLNKTESLLHMKLNGTAIRRHELTQENYLAVVSSLQILIHNARDLHAAMPAQIKFGTILTDFTSKEEPWVNPTVGTIHVKSLVKALKEHVVPKISLPLEVISATHALLDISNEVVTTRSIQPLPPEPIQ